MSTKLVPLTTRPLSTSRQGMTRLRTTSSRLTLARWWRTTPSRAAVRSIPVACGVGPGDEEQLDRQPRVERRSPSGDSILEALRLERHLDVGREDGHEGGDAPGAAGSARAWVH